MCDGDLIAGGYTQLDVITGAPPVADCDEISEYGRMKVDADAGVSLLYICTADEWVSIHGKAVTPPGHRR
jgi:hypothetical protein